MPKKINNITELIKINPELFDGYDGKDRSLEQQRNFDADQKALLDTAPDYIKQAISDRNKS